MGTAKFERSSGILLHPTSLPGQWGVGTLGSEAYYFVDMLAEMKQKLWQVLPLYPTDFSESPYSALSAFAGNPLLISPEILFKEGLLDKKDLPEKGKFLENRVDFVAVRKNREQLFQKAFSRFIKQADIKTMQGFDIFKTKEKWLTDFCLFMAIRQHNNLKPWNKWEMALKYRNEIAVKQFRSTHQKEINYHAFLQFCFFKQWEALKAYANNKGISIIGDNPIYVAYDNADVWSNPELFELDRNLNPKRVAGVPPDCFSATGQLWGNPIYDWEQHRKTGFGWWKENLKASFRMTDIVRIDHFIGFVRYWAVPYSHKTAEKGKWIKGPRLEFFQEIQKSLGDIHLIAEDLGATTEEVINIRHHMGFPGMKILQEAFDGNPNHHFLPHNYTSDFVVYTGTHDTDTSLSSVSKMSLENKQYMKKYIGSNVKGKELVWELIRLAFASPAVMAIIPMQDILVLGNEARMNLPGTISGNWIWRYRENQLKPEMIKRIKELSSVYGR